MQITVNGKPVALDGEPSVRGLLQQYDLGSAACAVEVNENLVPRREHERHRLAEGDRVEIVTLVGGG